MNRSARLSVAPMMELTDRHFRYLARLLTRHALLYSEMLTAAAVIYGDRDYLLGKSPREDPVVLQLGGAEPQQMAEAAAIGEAYGYAAVNMNVGCPSDRVKAGRFGACLMAEPERVARCVAAMQEAVRIPVSVKCRLGIDRDDSYAALERFVRVVAASGCRHFVVHARKAWLDGLSPQQNREIPPLRYPYVHRLKRRFPHLHITINGGITDWPGIERQLERVDGVMLGRQAYYHPAVLGNVDQRLFADLEGALPALDWQRQAEVARDYARYMRFWMSRGVRVSGLCRHLVALYQAVPGARQWRRHLSLHAARCTDPEALIDDALAFVSR